MASATSEGVYIHGNRTKKTCNGGHRTIKKGASTDPKKHFEVINFILGHFVNFLEEIYQEKILDVSSPLRIINKKPKRLENSQLLRKTSHLNQILELILKQCVANYYYGHNTIAK